MKSEVKLLLIIIAYFVFAFIIQVKIILRKNTPINIKVFNSIIIWILPFIGAWAINWIISYKESSKKDMNKDNWNLNESGIGDNV